MPWPFCVNVDVGRCWDSGPDPHDTSNILGDISIIHLNIRSIIHELDFVAQTFSDFDILCFTETHLNNTISSDDLAIDNFDSCIYTTN